MMVISPYFARSCTASYSYYKRLLFVPRKVRIVLFLYRASRRSERKSSRPVVAHSRSPSVRYLRMILYCTRSPPFIWSRLPAGSDEIRSLFGAKLSVVIEEDGHVLHTCINHLWPRLLLHPIFYAHSSTYRRCFINNNAVITIRQTVNFTWIVIVYILWSCIISY